MNMQTLAALVLVLVLGTGTSAVLAGPISSTFQVQMTVRSSCVVSTPPGDINLGSVATQPAAVRVSGNNTIDVNCSKKTPFFIGLAPSDGNNRAKGNMRGARPGNTNKVPYTLYSNAALTRIWGNTATSTRRGNGVAGTGKGMAPVDALSFRAYAEVTNVNFTPDSYADTVTVSVHY